MILQIALAKVALLSYSRFKSKQFLISKDEECKYWKNNNYIK